MPPHRAYVEARRATPTARASVRRRARLASPPAPARSRCALSNITIRGKALEVNGVDVLATLSSGCATECQLQGTVAAQASAMTALQTDRHPRWVCRWPWPRSRANWTASLCRSPSSRQATNAEQQQDVQLVLPRRRHRRDLGGQEAQIQELQDESATLASLSCQIDAFISRQLKRRERQPVDRPVPCLGAGARQLERAPPPRLLDSSRQPRKQQCRERRRQQHECPQQQYSR